MPRSLSDERSEETKRRGDETPKIRTMRMLA